MLFLRGRYEGERQRGGRVQLEALGIMSGHDAGWWWW